MAPRKKNLTKRSTVKVPYATLYTHDSIEGKPKVAGQPAVPGSESPSPAPPPRKQVPSFAKKE